MKRCKTQELKKCGKESSQGWRSAVEAAEGTQLAPAHRASLRKYFASADVLVLLSSPAAIFDSNWNIRRFQIRAVKRQGLAHFQVFQYVPSSTTNLQEISKNAPGYGWYWNLLLISYCPFIVESGKSSTKIYQNTVVNSGWRRDVSIGFIRILSIS